MKRPNNSSPLVCLNGERDENHFHVFLLGKKVLLTACSLNAFVGLVLARLSPGTGFYSCERVTICRLRRAIDRALGRGWGPRLIETGCGEEYRLAIPRDDLLAQLAIDPTFFELEKLRVVPTTWMDEFRRLYRAQSRLKPK